MADELRQPGGAAEHQASSLAANLDGARPEQLATHAVMFRKIPGAGHRFRAMLGIPGLGRALPQRIGTAALAEHAVNQFGRVPHADFLHDVRPMTFDRSRA